MIIQDDNKKEFTPVDVSFNNKKKSAKIHNFENIVNGVIFPLVGLLGLSVFLVYLIDLVFKLEVVLKDMLLQSLWLFFCTATSHFLLRNYAKRKGRASEEWQKACNAFQEKAREIKTNKWEYQARIYCKEYEEEAYKRTVTDILETGNIDFKIFEEHFKKLTKKQIYDITKGEGAVLTKRQAGAILKAQKVKKYHYDERFLMIEGGELSGSKTPSQRITAEQQDKISGVWFIFCCVFGTFFLAMLIPDVVKGASLASFLIATIKTLAFLCSCTTAFVGGFFHAKKTETKMWQIRANEQDLFLAWREKNKNSLALLEIDESKNEREASERIRLYAEQEEKKAKEWLKNLLNAEKKPTEDEKEKGEELLEEDEKSPQSENTQAPENATGKDTTQERKIN